MQQACPIPHTEPSDRSLLGGARATKLIVSRTTRWGLDSTQGAELGNGDGDQCGAARWLNNAIQEGTEEEEEMRPPLLIRRLCFSLSLAFSPRCVSLEHSSSAFCLRLSAPGPPPHWLWAPLGYGPHSAMGPTRLWASLGFGSEGLPPLAFGNPHLVSLFQIHPSWVVLFMRLENWLELQILFKFQSFAHSRIENHTSFYFYLLNFRI